MTECEFEFQQLCPVDDRGREIYGLMIDGTAYLKSSRDDGSYTDEFYVDAVEILGARMITRREAEVFPNTFNGTLFKAIADIIENPKTDFGSYAQSEFSDAVASEMEPA